MSTTTVAENTTAEEVIPAEFRAWIYQHVNGSLTAIDLREQTSYDIPPGRVWCILRLFDDGEVVHLNHPFHGAEDYDYCLPLDDFLDAVLATNKWFDDWLTETRAKALAERRAKIDALITPNSDKSPGYPVPVHWLRWCWHGCWGIDPHGNHYRAVDTGQTWTTRAGGVGRILWPTGEYDRECPGYVKAVKHAESRGSEADSLLSGGRI